MGPAASGQSKKRVSARALLAANVVSLRRTRELSQEALAFEAGLHRTFVAHVERQVRNISLDNIENSGMEGNPLAVGGAMI